MREQVFMPLGMTRTEMTWQPRFESDFANGYDEKGDSLGPQRRTVGDAAGSMQTTLRDYARFVQAVMNGELPGASSRAMMLAPQIRIHSAHEFPTLDTQTTRAYEGMRLSYGLGWGLYWTALGESFFKEGHDDGWRHYVVCFEERKAGMLIMTNSSNGEDVYGALLEGVLGDPYTPYEWEGFRRPGQP
jgi:CubicO group peptidase (beta-lactamase class C family)